MLTLIVYILAFLALSGLLAMVDAAVLSVTRAETEEMIVQKKTGAVALQSLKRHITRGVVVIVLVTNTINVLGPILVGQKAVELYSSAIIGVITAVLTFGTIIFSEIIPKSVGTHYAPFISRCAAPVVLWLTWGLYPVVWSLERIARFFQRGEREFGTETQIRSLVSIGLRSERIEKDEGQLIHNAFLLNDLTAGDIMTPREKVVSISSAATVREAAKVIFAHEFSRYPVTGESPDDVLGMVLSREILSALARGKDHDPISSMIHATPRIPPTKHSDGLLAMFRQRQIHLATVHKDNRLLGLVTLEDVLEELVGEIEDEKDTA